MARIVYGTITRAGLPLGYALVFSIAAVVCADVHAAKVSEFGFDPDDSTEIIQKALDSGARQLVFDRQTGPWVTRPLAARSNTEIIFEDGVELVAKRGEFHGLRDFLFCVDCVTNIVLRGLGGKGGTFRMWKKDYQDLSKYEKSEWRHTLYLRSVENVIVENMTFKSSGGDGVAFGARGDRNCRNVVFRRCVFDDNHRQGISICSGENILIEDCILSNTKGTPPEAGIDFEPDRPNECLSNITLRNVLSINNAGNGADVYPVQMRDFSTPVSIILENFRSIGNRCGVFACANDRIESGHVRGKVEFRNCLFADSRDSGLTLRGLPKGAMDLSFENCIVSNCAPEKMVADVILKTEQARQGYSDGIDFGNLTIYQPRDRDWFRCGQGCFGPRPRNVSGEITVVKPGGRVEKRLLDDVWRTAAFPLVGDGRMPPPRVRLPQPDDVEIIDEHPGEMAELSPVFTCYHPGNYVFFAEKAGPCRFFVGQYAPAPGRKATEGDIQIARAGGGSRRWKMKIPGFDGGEIVFDAPARGFYVMTLPTGKNRARVYKASVPVALYFPSMFQIVAGENQKPFTVWFENPGDKDFLLLANGDNSYYRYTTEICAPSGVVAFKGDNQADANIIVSGKAGEAERGLWSATFGPTEKPHYSWINIDISGVPPVVFLSREKRWTTIRPNNVSEHKETR